MDLIIKHCIIIFILPKKLDLLIAELCLSFQAGVWLSKITKIENYKSRHCSPILKSMS